MITAVSNTQVHFFKNMTLLDIKQCFNGCWVILTLHNLHLLFTIYTEFFGACLLLVIPHCFIQTAPMERNSTLPPLFSGNHSYTNGTCSRDNVLKTVVFPVLYSFLFLLGLILNSVAVWVFFRIPSKSHFIIYLKNIVVADVVMTFTFPFKVWFALVLLVFWYCLSRCICLLSYKDHCHSLINRLQHHQLIICICM